ncbi:GGDEF domain-containing protein [Cloacibacillus sp.]
MISLLKHFLGFQQDDGDKDEIFLRLYESVRRPQLVLHLLIIAFEVFMLFLISSKDGGPFLKPRRTAYFILYLLLIAVTCAVTLIQDRFFHNDPKNYRRYFITEHIYIALLCLWSTALTLNDQLGGNGLSVYTYVAIISAAISLMQPWKSLLLYGGNFILLNALLPYFPWPNGLNQTFNNFTNSLFVAIIAFMLANYFYKSQLRIKRDEIVIERQYKELERANKTLSREVMTDSLTQLHNRRYLRKVICEHFPKRERAACLMIDIDHFKLYNDCNGHLAGDRLLIDISEYLRGELCGRCADLVRYGGEEFIAFLYGKEALEANLTAEKIRRDVESLRCAPAAGEEKHITVSIGLHHKEPDEQITVRELILRADEALYRAKEGGRNRIVWSSAASLTKKEKLS